MEKLPFNDTSRISDLIIKDCFSDIEKVIKSGRWLLGEFTEKFSQAFSQYLDVKYCVPLANGTDALEIALKAVSEGKAGEVITVANAGGYTSTACILAGLKPVYIDIHSNNMLMNIDLLTNILNKNTIALVVTHLYGRAVDIFKVKEMLAQLGYSHVPIIEDCAQAHGAKIRNKFVGSLGDLATFSFYPTKNLGALGDAGAITTNSLDLKNRVKMLSQYGWTTKYNIGLKNSRNSRMDEIQAAILLNLLPKLDAWNEKRRSIYTRYIEASPKNIELYCTLNNSNVVHLAILKTKNRERFIEYMREHNISVDIHYPILDTEQKVFFTDIHNQLPVSKQVISEIVSLPCFPTMTDVEISAICDALSRWKND